MVRAATRLYNLGTIMWAGALQEDWRAPDDRPLRFLKNDLTGLALTSPYQRRDLGNGWLK